MTTTIVPITLDYPLVARLADDELEARFPDRDGRWSSAIKAALRRFSTDKLTLNDEWAATAPDWACPGCGRSKPDLVRLSDRGVLLAQLELHHDHLSDVLKARLKQRFGSHWATMVPAGTAHVEHEGAALVARFEPCVVCVDCNAADGAAKGRVRVIPPAFSFSPAEIATVVRARPNREHVVDHQRAYALFESVRANFEQRVQLVERLFALMTEGVLARATGSPAPHRSFTLDPATRVYSRLLWTDPEAGGRISADLDSFYRRSIARDGTASRAQALRAAAERPSAAEVAAYDGGGAPELWQAVPASWRCAGCDRDKSGILRRTNNGARRWSGKIQRHTDYVIEDEGEDDSRIRVDHHRYLLVCMDCASILPGLKQRCSRIARGDALFQLADLQAVITPADNRRHEVDWVEATRRAIANLDLIDAVQNYRRHLEDSVGCRVEFRRLLRRYDGTAIAPGRRSAATTATAPTPTTP